MAVGAFLKNSYLHAWVKNPARALCPREVLSRPIRINSSLRSLATKITTHDQENLHVSQTPSTNPSCNGNEIEKGTINKVVAAATSPDKPTQELTRYDWINFLDEILNEKPVVLLIKGTPDAPRCGHSAKLLAVMESLGVNRYITVDVLQSPVLRETAKEMSQCGTFPQLYIKGTLYGGANDAFEGYKDGSLEALIRKNNITLLDKPQSKTE